MNRIEELQSDLGQRGGQSFNGTHRTKLRSWLGAKTGFPAVKIIPLGMAELSAMYNDGTDRLIEAWVKPAAAETTAQETPDMKKTYVPRTQRELSSDEIKALPVDAADAAALAAILARMKGGNLDEERVRSIAAEEAAKVKAPERVIVMKDAPDAPKVDLGVCHRMFPLLLATVKAGLNAALVGPAGSGKTHAAHAVSLALGVPFELQGTCVTKSDITGFIDGQGRYQETPFSRSFTKGGVLLCDELDGWHPNPTLALNAALANGHTSLPTGMVSRHESWHAIMAMNTYGTGASRQYVGRNQMDAATLNRLAVIDWGYDEALEASMAGVTKRQEPVDISEGGIPTASSWLARVQKIRHGVESAKVRHIVSPRATMGGLALFRAGVGQKWAEEMLVWQGLDDEQRKRVEAAAR